MPGRKELTRKELERMSDAELLEVSKRKDKKGRYTREANLAMAIRRERSGHWEYVPCRAPENEILLRRYEGYPPGWWES